MTKVKKVLFVTHEITPYVPETAGSNICRTLPAAVQESGCEIRTFMPKWGNINERRGQLHEVIRLSGMNLIIDDTDHPLLIKVASITAARMQVYFIDNEDYFMKRLEHADAAGNEYTDNGERAIFYVRGVLETIKKLRWIPDVIHCHGWISALAPLYLKKAYNEDPSFAKAKVVYSLYNDNVQTIGGLNTALLFKGVNKKVVKTLELPEEPTLQDLQKLAVRFSDGVIAATPDAPAEVLNFARESGCPVLDYPGEDFITAYQDFYDSLL